MLPAMLGASVVVHTVVLAHGGKDRPTIINDRLTPSPQPPDDREHGRLTLVTRPAAAPSLPVPPFRLPVLHNMPACERGAQGGWHDIAAALTIVRGAEHHHHVWQGCPGLSKQSSW
eukprot:SAG31_NODE_20077_length_584_cov_1.084536_1_plen_115_part_01